MMRSAATVLLILALAYGCHRQTASPPKPQTTVRTSRGGVLHPATAEPQLSYDELVRRGMNELELKNAMHDRAFQISRAAWNVDQDAGLIRFESPDGILAIAQVQIIGSYNTADGTWLWAWDNPSVNPSLAQLAGSMREYGQQNNLPELTTAKLECDQEHCWTFVAAAAAMTNAQGGYRGMAGETAVFMTFGPVDVSKQK